jgi:hypothetical protein
MLQSISPLLPSTFMLSPYNNASQQKNGFHANTYDQQYPRSPMESEQANRTHLIELTEAKTPTMASAVTMPPSLTCSSPIKKDPKGRFGESSNSSSLKSSEHIDDEKLRISRERNRLHAQRTRMRKRELLENLKQRISSLKRENALLVQAYEFHVTAVCLLGLGEKMNIKSWNQFGERFLDMQDLEEMPQVQEESLDLDHVLLEEDIPDKDDDLDDCASVDSTTSSQNGRSSRSSTLSNKEHRENLRRERNRLHARRARLRKKMILERSQKIVEQLRHQNDRLHDKIGTLMSELQSSQES